MTNPDKDPSNPGVTITELGTDILKVENFLDAALCQHILQIAQTCNFHPASILTGQVDTDVRSSDILPLGDGSPLQISTNQLFMGRLPLVQQILRDRYGVNFAYAEPFSILRYGPNQAYQRHIDNIRLASRFQELEQGIPTRDVSLVGYLNENFEGGETYFDRQSLTVTPQSGSIILFPATYTHPHQALAVRQGVKYAFNTWLYYSG